MVQLISLKSGSKAEFRDCSFKCSKVFHHLNSARTVTKQNNPKSARLFGQPQGGGGGRIRTDRSSASIKKHTENNAVVTPNNNAKYDNISGNAGAGNSISQVGGVGFNSEQKLNDSVSVHA